MPFVMFPMVIWLLILAGGFVLASRLIRALESRGGGGGEEVRLMQERLLRLEESLESVNSQLHRLDEAQQFTTRLLEGGLNQPGSDSGESRSAQ